MIKLNNIMKTFQSGEYVTKALDDVNLHVSKGEFVAIMGPSGSGKSTIMNILGLLDVPSSGEYILNDQNMIGLNEKQFARIRNQEIGFIFQSYNLLTRLSVARNVELPLIYQGVSKKQRQAKVNEALERVELMDKKDNKPNQLSGGQMQRVAIARALVTNPSFLLADEPTGALDQKTGKIVMELFQKLHQDGATIIFVTHDADVAAVAQRSIHILDGQVQQLEEGGMMHEYL